MDPRDSETPAGEVTQWLGDLGRDDGTAAARLMPLVSGELRHLAERAFRGQSPGHTLQPTALVHEAFLRLARPGPGAAAAPPAVPPDADAAEVPASVADDGSRVDEAGWRDREHFLAVAATAMRQILVDHARRKRTAKRGGDWTRVTLAGVAASEAFTPDVLDLDTALRELAERRPRVAEVVHLRFFGGLTEPAVARMIGCSRKTVAADWAFARAWLVTRLEADGPSGDGGDRAADRPAHD